jgi:hypothetical protein
MIASMDTALRPANIMLSAAFAGQNVVVKQVQ